MEEQNEKLDEELVEKSKNGINLLNVSFVSEKNTYNVLVPKGSNVNETAFCVMVIIKCLIRDGIIKDSKEFLDKVNQYLNDEQYNEVKNEQL